ncbi:MAG: hypothetical protein WB764_28400 [Xanthobacteraceae bacterium]
MSATTQGTGSILHVTVVTSDCKILELTARCFGTITTQYFALTSTTITADLTIPCPCGAQVVIIATCVDGNHQPVSGCTSGSYQGLIICSDPCCIEPLITAVVGPCDPTTNQQLVTFTSVWNVPATLPSTCYPIVGQLHFGIGSSVGLIQFINGPGTHSFPDTYSYPAATSTTYQAQFVYTNPSCPPVPVSVTVGPCAPPDCCPQVTNVTIDPGPCQSDCTRAVTIKTDFSPPSPGCLAETLQWQFYDKNGNLITNVNSIAFLTSGASPNVQTFIFDPALAPITAQLTGLQYPNCVAVVRTISILPCDVAPACPTINSFSANVMGCENVGGECLRRVDFTVAADIAAGCGANAGTTMQIDFGDGDQAQLSYSTSGPESTTISHHYAAGGSYVATLTILNPSPCPGQLINVQVPACTPQDCNMDGPCPPLPTPPPWCYCTLCYIFSQKHGKAWCKIILLIVALYISAIILGVFEGWISYNTSSFTNPNGSINWAMVVTWQNVITSLVLIGLIPAVVWYPHWCSDCCAACALLLGIILGIIAVIIALIFGYLSITVPSTTVPNTNVINPSFIAGIIVLIVLFLTWLIFNASCKQYAAQHLTADTWCKD